jgi:hypothetical protein
MTTRSQPRLPPGEANDADAKMNPRPCKRRRRWGASNGQAEGAGLPDVCRCAVLRLGLIGEPTRRTALAADSLGERCCGPYRSG